MSEEQLRELGSWEVFEASRAAIDRLMEKYGATLIQDPDDEFQKKTSRRNLFRSILEDAKGDPGYVTRYDVGPKGGE